MKHLLFILFLACYSYAYNQTPRTIVQKQLEAYNHHDIDAFMRVFSEDIELWTLGDTIPFVQGFASVKEIYVDLFDRTPDLFSEVISRTTIGNKVIDYEKITGRSGHSKGEILYLIMIYEVKDGKIFRATAVRE
jgi:hypothetical protein